MATTPHPPPKHDPPKHAPSHEQPAVVGAHAEPKRDVGPGGYAKPIGVSGKAIDDGERDPDTIAEEQRRRSEEMEKVGVDAYMKAHSAPTTEEEREKKQVPGVGEHKR